jgi:eukaryotic-like serine/threonine-protein kinase
VDVGTLLGSGRYEVTAELGEGAMGTVVRARRLEDGVEVAVKRLRDPRHAVRFEIETRLLARLSHPRVARVLDYFSEDGDSFLVMALVPGETLLRVLQRHGRPGLPATDVVAYARHVCEALEYVHAQHVVHRDVKPSNLVLGEDGVVLVDFGVAREVATTEEATIGVGTPAYMAPEVLVGGLVSPRADVYSLAATVWALLTGAPPRYGERERISALAADVPPELDGTLQAALSLEPAARPPGAGAFAAALGTPLARGTGASLARTIEQPRLPARTLAASARAAAGVLSSTAVSIGIADPATGELVYEAAWGAGADQIVGVRLPPGTGIAGSVLATGAPVAVPDCRADGRFAHAVAQRTGYIPHTMIVLPLRVPGLAPAVLQALDRRDGRPYTDDDLEPARHAAELVAIALTPVVEGTETVAPAGTTVPSPRLR